MALNLTNLWRRLPVETTSRIDYRSPAGDVAEVYTFNPTIERLHEQNMNAFRKPQINAAPDVINVTEWIWWLVAPITQEQERQIKIQEARSKIVWALGDMISWWLLATTKWIARAKTLIDLYNKLK